MSKKKKNRTFALSDETMQKLEAIKRNSNLNKTEALEYAIEELAAQLTDVYLEADKIINKILKLIIMLNPPITEHEAPKEEEEDLHDRLEICYNLLIRSNIVRNDERVMIEDYEDENQRVNKHAFSSFGDTEKNIIEDWKKE